jgi:hypothetical protein
MLDLMQQELDFSRGSTVKESTMLETVWIDKDTFQFSAVA